MIVLLKFSVSFTYKLQQNQQNSYICENFELIIT
jgi:hypothetical protein